MTTESSGQSVAIIRAEASRQRQEPLGDDSQARSEKQEYYSARQRMEELRKVFHQIFLWGLRIAFCMFVVIGVVRGLHLILPESGGWLHCWLSTEQVQTIDSILTSGALGAAVGRYLGPILGRPKPSS